MGFLCRSAYYCDELFWAVLDNLPLTLPLKSESCFLCPHLVYASMNITCFPEFTLIGFRIDPQSAQNSIDYFFVNFFWPIKC